MVSQSQRKKPPDAKGATESWQGIWNASVEHKHWVEWIDKTREKMIFEKQNAVRATKDEVSGKLKSIRSS